MLFGWYAVLFFCAVAKRENADRTVSPDVSARMRRVRVRDTAPEVAVRRLLFDLGARFRVCPSGLPGRPDIVNQRRGWCVLVHGCFWHGHHCRRGRRPKTNVAFWTAKAAENRRRDARVVEALSTAGLRCIIVWQCELDEVDRLRARLKAFLP